MNLDDLMAVWRSQDAAPVHGVNEALLRLALRQDEAKLLAERRRERWWEYFGAAVGFGLFAFFLSTMAYRYDGDSATVWDFAIPIMGMAAALLSGRAMYVRHRGQTLREQHFGESLRDQINRQIAQLDFWATRVHRARVWREALLGVVIATIVTLAWWRASGRPSSDARLAIPIVGSIVGYIIWLAVSLWWSRRRLQREVLPRKRRLEALLTEVDGQ